jgi:exodeoxyribonuclease VII small subunit
MAKRKTQTEFSFEEALDKLETIVKKMETGDLPLDEALAQFAEGVNLSQFCLEKINRAEKEIDKILLEKQGKIVEQPLQTGEDGTC